MNPYNQYPVEILCLGAINMDLVMYMEHIPKPGETITTDNFHKYPGGKGSNQAVAASIFLGKVNYLGKIGDDSFSDELIRGMSMNKVDTTHIIREENSPSGIAMIFVDSKGQNYIAFTPGANSLLSVDDIRNNTSLFKPNGILLITLEIGIENVCEAIKVAKGNGMFVILDPAPYNGEVFPKWLPALVDVIKPNENETSFLTGIQVSDFESAERAMLELLSMGFQNPIITLGDKGLIYHFRNDTVRVEPIKVKSIDSTAAGDVFLGALAASLSRGYDFANAIAFASAAASLSTTRMGAQTSIPSIEEVERLLQKQDQ